MGGHDMSSMGNVGGSLGVVTGNSMNGVMGSYPSSVQQLCMPRAGCD